MNRARLATVLTTLAMTIAAPAAAHFSDDAAAGQDLTTATLAAPTSPAATPGTCSTTAGDEAVIEWTATTSTWADGYQIWRATGTSGTFERIATLSNPGTTAHTDTGLGYSTTYTYVVRATAKNWTSADTTEVSVTTRTADCL